MSNWGNLQLFWLQAANDSHFGDLQMSKKRYLLQKKMPYNISHLCGAIVSSFNGEQLKKCDSLYISKGIREYSRGVFITHDLGYPAYTGSSEAKCDKVSQYFNYRSRAIITRSWFEMGQLSHHLTVNNWKSATLSISQR